MQTVTITQDLGFEAGDEIQILIDNGFWKVFNHWIFRKKLRRYNTYTNISTYVFVKDD